VRLSVIIPAYNEEHSIAEVLGRTLRCCSFLSTQIPGLDGFEVIVVNDGSQDGTRGVVEQFAGVTLVNHPRNRGYGAALKMGLAASQGDYLAFLDADGTYPPECLPDLLNAALETGADMVVGSRMGGARSGMPFLRKVGNAIFAWLLSWLVSARITDTASGMRVFKRSVLDRLRRCPTGLTLPLR
jgi:glycosyltransferase involved in cell wall biosynthesis